MRKPGQLSKIELRFATGQSVGRFHGRMRGKGSDFLLGNGMRYPRRSGPRGDGRFSSDILCQRHSWVGLLYQHALRVMDPACERRADAERRTVGSNRTLED